MTRDVQLSEPAEELLRAIETAVPGWLRRCVVETASRAGSVSDELRRDADELVAREAPRLVAELAELLGTDVDEQRSNPLASLRAAVAAPNELLRAHGVPAPPVDPFAARHFPDDVYGLGPASWSDVDPGLHQPGLVWSAWKAMTVLQRRRDEGLR